jgi:hypothetical protein
VPNVAISRGPGLGVLAKGAFVDATDVSGTPQPPILPVLGGSEWGSVTFADEPTGYDRIRSVVA